MDKYIQLAQDTIENYVNGKDLPKSAEQDQELLDEKAGVFVSIKKNGDLRGCIGTTGPTTSSIAEEIIQNAISASTKDPRFKPITPDELDNLTISVDILKTPESVDSIDDLDCKRYGVIVQNGMRQGLLLPNLEGVNSVKEQLLIAMQKAGIAPNEPIAVRRFEVIRHE